jgi:hypothetical protein
MVTRAKSVIVALLAGVILWTYSEDDPYPGSWRPVSSYEKQDECLDALRKKYAPVGEYSGQRKSASGVRQTAMCLSAGLPPQKMVEYGIDLY